MLGQHPPVLRCLVAALSVGLVAAAVAVTLAGRSDSTGISGEAGLSPLPVDARDRVGVGVGVALSNVTTPPMSAQQRGFLLQFAPHLRTLVDASPLPFDPQYRSPCWREPGGKELLCMPYLYLAGMPKCSTSTLFVEISNSHPLIAPNCDVSEHII